MATTPQTNTPQNPQQRQQQQKRRKRKSRYGGQLQEKQDLKKLFGIREEQLKRYYREARSNVSETGPTLISLLERRLDNAIFRAGFADTRAQARQMSTHRLFAINGRSVDVPSQQLRPGDVVTVREGKRKKSYFTNFDKKLQNVNPPSWIELSPEAYSFTIKALPTVEEANLGVDIRAIVEFFAR